MKGVAWLGDYDSSVTTVNASTFMGGTPKYQLACITIEEGGRLFALGGTRRLLRYELDCRRDPIQCENVKKKEQTWKFLNTSQHKWKYQDWSNSILEPSYCDANN